MPRELIERARSTPAAEDGSADPLADVRDMLAWAEQHGIRLVNVHEVFNAAGGIRLDPYWRMEHTKQVGLGYAAASDILRLEILRRFGGLYSDGDNEIVGVVTRSGDPLPDPARRGDLRAELRRLVEPAAPGADHGQGFALHLIGWGVSNSAVLAARRHPFPDLYLDYIREGYAMSQRQLYDRDRNLLSADTEPVADATVLPPGWWLNRSRQTTAHRYSVVMRTGPDILERLSARLGLDRSYHLPGVRGIRMGGGGSWLGPDGRRRVRRSVDDPAVLRAVTAVISTLVRELHNRDGDLHLTLVAPAIARLPHPQAVWNTVIQFIAQTPELAARVRTVTASRLTEDGLQAVPLPPAAGALLGLDETGEPVDPHDAERESWWLDERVLPARLSPAPGHQPPVLWTPPNPARPYAYLLLRRMPNPAHGHGVPLTDGGIALMVDKPRVPWGWQLLRMRVPAGTAVDVHATLHRDPNSPLTEPQRGADLWVVHTAAGHIRVDKIYLRGQATWSVGDHWLIDELLANLIAAAPLTPNQPAATPDVSTA